MLIYNTRKEIILKLKIYKIENKKLHGSGLHSPQFSKTVAHFSLFPDRNSRNVSGTDLQESTSSDTKACLSFLRRSSRIPLLLGDPKEDFCEDDLESSGLKTNE